MKTDMQLEKTLPSNHNIQAMFMNKCLLPIVTVCQFKSQDFQRSIITYFLKAKTQYDFCF